MRGICTLIEIETPSGTVYLCDAGFIEYGGQIYEGSSAFLGGLEGVQLPEEGLGVGAPTVGLIFNPPSAAAFSALSQGALQRYAVNIRLAEYDVASNNIVGTPEYQFKGQLDQPSLSYSKGEYKIKLTAVSKMEWLFERNTGNNLSSATHKAFFPGETGQDNATGLGVSEAWGAEKPVSSTGGGGGSGNGVIYSSAVDFLQK